MNLALAGGDIRYFLTSLRLGFRYWAEDDLHLAMQLWGDSEVTALIGGPFTSEAIQERLSKEIAQMQKLGVQYWPIFLLENNQHVGCAGLRPRHAEFRAYELGIHLRRDSWGKGFATEAAHAAIHYGFNTLGAEALFAGHNPKNEASRRLLATVGFEYTHDEFYAPTGLMHPSYLLKKPRMQGNAPPPNL